MNPLATELNEIIRQANPHVFEMLSTLGREMYFPKGILTQSAEAKAKASKFNATLGVAMEQGHLMSLPSLMKSLDGLTADETLNYAPVTGIAELREAWMEKQFHDNPSLKGKPMSLPIATNGLTHALSIMADLFCEPGDALLLPDQIWGNYKLTFCTRRDAEVVTYPFYAAEGGFNVEAFRTTLQGLRATRNKTIVLLNFPNNPTGYSITKSECAAVAEALIEAAKAGRDLVVIVDDAYFGLFYEADVCAESLFSRIAGAHERLLAVKCDAATKEVFVWGLRVGFISFSVGGAAADSPLYAALEKKVSGEIRGVMSNCSMLSQRVVLKALRSPTFYEERRARQETLRGRAMEVKRVLAEERFAEAWAPHDFNSGYFMCLRLKKAGAEALRKRLLERYGIGTIATAERDLRIAFSCVEKEHIAELFDTILKAANEIA
jgi:aspartate/methionine/tyrosine aminotransferase